MASTLLIILGVIVASLLLIALGAWLLIRAAARTQEEHDVAKRLMGLNNNHANNEYWPNC